MLSQQKLEESEDLEITNHGDILHRVAVTSLTNDFQKVLLVNAIKSNTLAKDAILRSYTGKIAAISIILNDDTVLAVSERDYEPEVFLRGEIRMHFLKSLTLV